MPLAAAAGLMLLGVTVGWGVGSIQAGRALQAATAAVEDRTEQRLRAFQAEVGELWEERFAAARAEDLELLRHATRQADERIRARLALLGEELQTMAVSTREGLQLASDTLAQMVSLTAHTSAAPPAAGDTTNP